MFGSFMLYREGCKLFRYSSWYLDYFNCRIYCTNFCSVIQDSLRYRQVLKCLSHFRPGSRMRWSFQSLLCCLARAFLTNGNCLNDFPNSWSTWANGFLQTTLKEIVCIEENQNVCTVNCWITAVTLKVQNGELSLEGTKKFQEKKCFRKSQIWDNRGLWFCD